MNSLIIGIARVGDADNQLLSPNVDYISMCGSYPEVSFTVNCKQKDFFDKIKLLRYDDADPDASAPGISFFEELITKIFTDLKYLSIKENETEPLHIRLVTAPIELAQLPFEFGLNPAGTDQIPLLLNPDRKIMLTREVRQVVEAGYNWPVQPRILFAWAQPSNTVPHDAHTAVFKKLVKPLARPKKDIADPEPDTDIFFTELSDVSLESLSKEIDNAIAAKKPYTHLHMLVHGGHNTDFTGFEFGQLLLCQDGNKEAEAKAGGDDLIKAIIKKDYVPAVVSLSSCDSGNAGNVMQPAGSLMHQLHNAGIPCIFASQFPLTQDGSVIMTETLYSQLINACDPRLALYETRMALKDSQHDWASLVAYARFPENINDQLQSTRLKMLFDSMKITTIWVDHVFKYQEKITSGKKEDIFADLQNRLDTSIARLSELLNNDTKQSTLTDVFLKSEHLGLLGSAYKRKAEYLYRLIEFKPGNKQDLLNQSLDALNTAKEFYYSGFDANTSSHWNAMQYLSIKAVIENSLSEENEVWTVVKFMAQKDEKNAAAKVDKIWAWGTLAELYMLKPLLSSTPSAADIDAAVTISKNYVEMMAAAGEQYNAQIESTARQFERYIFWWPQIVAEESMNLLKSMATKIRSALPALDALI